MIRSTTAPVASWWRLRYITLLGLGFGVGWVATRPRLLVASGAAMAGVVALWTWNVGVIAVTVSWDYYVRSVGITVTELIIVIVLFGAVLAWLMGKRPSLSWDLIDTVVVALGVVVLVGGLLHPSLNRGFIRVVGRWEAACALYFVTRSLRRPTVRSVLLAFVASACVAGLVGLQQLATHNANDHLALIFAPQISGQNLVGTNVGRVRALFGSATEYGSFLAMVIPVWASMAGATKGLGRLVWVLGGLILLINLVGTATRGAWFGVAAGLVFLILVMARTQRVRYFWLMLAIVGGVWWWLSRQAVQYTTARLTLTALIASASRRWGKYRAAGAYIWAHPLGGGPLAFGQIANVLSFGNTENALLHIMVEFGIPAGLVLATLFVALLLRGRPEKALVAEWAGILAAVVALAVRSVVDPTLSEEPQVLFTFFLLAGLLVRIRAPSSPSKEALAVANDPLESVGPPDTRSHPAHSGSTPWD